MSKKMKQLHLFVAALGFFLSVQTVLGQGTPNNRLPAYVEENEKRRQEMNKYYDKTRGGMIRQADNGRRQATYNSAAAARKRKLSKAELERFNAKVAPRSEDLSTYKNFLLLPGTGIFRLFQSESCASSPYLEKKSDCSGLLPDGSAYSLRKKGYESLYDIRLTGNEIIADGYLSQNILVSLGGVRLEDVSISDSGLKFLRNFQPEQELNAVRTQYKVINNGLRSEGYKYSNKAPAALNETFALRIIAYRTEKSDVEIDGQKLSDETLKTLSDDERIDLTIAFRIIRKEESGTMTILWKQLERKESPMLVLVQKKSSNTSNGKEPK